MPCERCTGVGTVCFSVTRLGNNQRMREKTYGMNEPATQALTTVNVSLDGQSDWSENGWKTLAGVFHLIYIFT